MVCRWCFHSHTEGQRDWQTEPCALSLSSHIAVNTCSAESDRRDLRARANLLSSSASHFDASTFSARTTRSA